MRSGASAWKQLLHGISRKMGQELPLDLRREPLAVGGGCIAWVVRGVRIVEEQPHVLPGGIVSDVQGYEPVLAGHERSGTALLRLPGVQGAKYLGREHRRRGFKSRYFHILAAPGYVSIREGGHRAQKRARSRLECRLEAGLLQRLSFGRPIGVALTGCRVLLELSGDVITPRTCLTERCDRDVYQSGSYSASRDSYAKPRASMYPGGKRLHQHIRVREQVGGRRAVSLERTRCPA